MALKALSRREFMKATTATVAVTSSGWSANGAAQAPPPTTGSVTSTAQNQLVVYPAPEGEAPSSDYEVEVNGKPVPVYAIKSQWHDKKYSAAYFDFAGDVSVKIKPNPATLNTTAALDQLAIRPSKYGIAPTVDNGVASFSTDKHFDISFEPTGQNSPLHLFSNPIEVNPPKPGDPNVIYFGPGVHKPTRIDLTAGQTLYIAGGAVVKSAVTSNGDNIRIMGRGILCGDDWPHSQGPTARMVWPADGENILIENIIIRGAWNWTVAPSRCDRVLIRNLRICGSRCGNDDGIDPCNSSNVTIRNCFIHTDDDGIAVKGTASVGQNPKASENIVVEDCTFWIDFANGFRIGYESRAKAIRNFTARNIDFIHFPNRVQVNVFLLQPFANMPMENLVFEDIRINGEQPLKLVEITAYQQMRRPGSLPATSTGANRRPEQLVVPGDGPYVHNVTFRDITVYGQHDGQELSPFISMHGLDAGHDIENVKLTNVTVHGERVTSKTKDVQIGDFVAGIVLDDPGADAQAPRP
jgi:hypothetical protein